MEYRPIINLTASTAAPGADPDDFRRYLNWSYEVYAPISVALPMMTGADRYRIVKENPEYPMSVSIGHYLNLKDRMAYAESTEGIAVVNEFKLWHERGIIDQVWSTNYALLKSYRSKPVFSTRNEDTRPQNASIMHIEAYRLSPEQQVKYSDWFKEDGCQIFMPLFMKLPGMIGYDWFVYTGLSRKENVREIEYPRYLSLVYFEDINGYEAFAQSAELGSFLKMMKKVFPLGLKYEWYVQYQLVRSYRK
jgi:hypothetical protein